MPSKKPTHKFLMPSNKTNSQVLNFFPLCIKKMIPESISYYVIQVMSTKLLLCGTNTLKIGHHISKCPKPG